MLRKFHRRRSTVLTLAATLAVSAAVAIAIVSPATGNAPPVRPAIPLAQTRLATAVKAAVATAARQRNVDPALVVELGGSGSGPHRHAVLAALDSAGAPVISFLTGFGMSDFVSGTRYAGARRPVVVIDSIEGPSTEARIVGVSGVAVAAVERVEVALVDGSTITIPVRRASGIPYVGFSYVATDSASFPLQVTGYSRGGEVVGTHRVDTRSLCPRGRPSCFD